MRRSYINNNFRNFAVSVGYSNNGLLVFSLKQRKILEISVMTTHSQAILEHVPTDRYLERLEALVQLMLPLQSLLNSKMAMFFTDNLWDSVLPDHLHQQLTATSSGLSLDHLYRELLAYCRLLYGIDRDSSFTGKPGNELEVLAQQIIHQTSVLKTFSSVMGSTQFDTEILHPSPTVTEGKKLNALFMMSEKKFVEVEQMSAFIAQRAAMASLQHIVDFGSGKGYLSAMLNMRYGLAVLGLELSEDNVKAANIRTRRMAKQWASLCNVVSDVDEKGTATDKQKPENQLTFSSCTVSGDMDLDSLIAENTEESDLSHPGHLLCGLHTCGSLGNDLVDVFRRSEAAKSLVFVGCCYHLMDEKFEEATTPERKESISLFPMSAFLIQRRVSLGRSARMLASQSPERILRNGIDESVRSIFFRALLQALLMRHGVHLGGLERVGKISVTGIDFAQYVASARQTVTVPSEITDDDARFFFAQHQHLEEQIAIVTLLRILMGPCVEQIVLLDRALFLSQQANVSCVHVVPLFDPLVSPRTWALCAQKSCTCPSSTK